MAIEQKFSFIKCILKNVPMLKVYFPFNYTMVCCLMRGIRYYYFFYFSIRKRQRIFFLLNVIFFCLTLCYHLPTWYQYLFWILFCLLAGQVTQLKVSIEIPFVFSTLKYQIDLKYYTPFEIKKMLLIFCFNAKICLETLILKFHKIISKTKTSAGTKNIQWLKI